MLAAASVKDEPGTLLLHTQKPWSGTGLSVLLFSPRWTLRHEAGRNVWSGDVPSPSPPDVVPTRLPWALLDRVSPQTDPCFVGIAGWLGYDIGASRWNVRHLQPPPFTAPDAWLAAYDAALVFGPGTPPHLTVADLGPTVGSTTDLHDRWNELAERLSRIPTATPAARATHATGAARDSTSSPEFFPRDWHRKAAETIQDHLRRGNAYQVNLTGFATAETNADPWSVFERTALDNPVAFAAYANTDEITLTCHSPEGLLWMRNGRAQTAPIKGTLAASANAPAALLASAKDRAEHVMIVDLCRNDLGRGCEYGSVTVEPLMQPLELSHLVHLISRIEGTPRSGQSEWLLDHLFPGGSITGAPKRRAIEIITDVERSRRGPYTGSIGYTDIGGHADWNIAIRTAVWQDGRVHFGCGGGIVLDSDPDLEFEEAQLKARAFFDTLRWAAPAARN